MKVFWKFLGSFLLGALLIVWLRWSGSLPRFSSSIEIKAVEEEYKTLTSFISTKLTTEKDVTKAEVQHSNNLRDDMWRQRTRSFLVSALLYVILGGATAFLFIGLEIENILDPAVIGKLISAGALWSSFYSFIDVKKTDEAIEAERERIDDESIQKIEELKKTFEEEIKKKIKKIHEGNETITDITNKYNDLVEKYVKIKDEKLEEGSN
jgi:hypothetical protein